MREGYVVVEPVRTPDAARFDTAMVWGRDFGMVSRPALCEQQADVFLQLGLVTLDSEMVVRSAPDQIVGQIALGQQRVGGDDAPGDVDGIEHRGGRLDLVRALNLIAVVEALDEGLVGTLGLEDASVQRGAHARQAQFFEALFDFRHAHGHCGYSVSD